MFDTLKRDTYKPGVDIFKDGDEGCCAYLIEDGKVEVTSFHNNKPHRIGTLGKGDLFGEMALIDNKPRTATVTTLEVTHVVKISRELIDAKLAKTDPIIEHLLRLVLQRYRSTKSSFNPSRYPEDNLCEESDRAFSETQTNLIDHIHIASDIEDALTRNEFRLFYQPIISMKNNQLAGYEALIRWQHPQDGLIPPMKFLNVAEQTDQILSIGTWTLKQACNDYRNLSGEHNNKEGKLFVSVNLSARQLLKAKDTAQFADILHEADIDPSCIKLELTETVLLEDPEYAGKILSALKAMGFQLSLDDFGTGFSSLSHLQKFPIDYIKIDQSFVKGMSNNSESRQIVKASIELAAAMGKQVIAEGVESMEEARELEKMDCAYGQGYYYAKPLPLDDAIEYMNTH